MNRNRCFPLILLTVWFCVAYSESLDSLRHKLESARGIERIRLLNQISQAYFKPILQDDLSPVLEYSGEALQLARQLNDTQGVITALSLTGQVYHFQGDFETALRNYLEVIRLGEEIQDVEGVAQATLLTSKIYDYLGSQETAIEYARRALRLYRAMDNYPRITETLSLLGNLNRKSGNFDEAFELYEQVYHLHREKSDLEGEFQSQVDIGTLYLDLEKYNKAVALYQGILRNPSPQINPITLSLAWNNLAWAQQQLGNFEDALYGNEQALAYRRKADNHISVASSLRNIGILYHDWGKPEMAREYIMQSLDLLQKYRESYNARIYLRDTFHTLYEMHKAGNQYQMALMFLEWHNTYRDLVEKYQSRERIAKIQATYEIEKEERRNELLRKENEIRNLEISRHKTIQFFFGIGTVFFLLVIWLLYRRYRERMKTNKRLEEAVFERTRELEEQMREKRLTETQLRNSEQTLTTILDSVHDAIFIHDRRGLIVNVNSKAVDLYGIPSEEIAGRQLHLDFSRDEEEADALVSGWERVISTGRPVIFEWRARTLQQKEDVDMEVVCTRILIGDSWRLLSSMRDITERKVAHRNALELERKSSALAMAVTANHEINQPLMVIKASLELLTMILPAQCMEDAHRKQFKRLEMAIDRIQEILTKFRRIESIQFDEYTEGEEMAVFEGDDIPSDPEED